MTGNVSSRSGIKIMVIALLLLLVLGVTPVLAADRTPPTAPRNLRVTSMTAYSVSLAWLPSTDNSGQFSYIICCANVSSETIPGNLTSHVYTAGLEAGRSFTLRMYARDAAGNYSRASNSVTFRLPPDTQPPGKPVVTATEIGSTHVSLSLSSVEDGPNIWFTIFMNGSPISSGNSTGTATITPLQPNTTYTFTAQARDFAGLLSPISDPLTVTTAPANTSDTTPPTTPTNLHGWNFDEEIDLFWTQSTDNVTPQSLIQYEIYLNGTLDHITVGRGRTVLYGVAGMLNTIEVVAVDASGNKSAAATTTFNIP